MDGIVHVIDVMYDLCIDDVGTAGSTRVLRGGCWFSHWNLPWQRWRKLWRQGHQEGMYTLPGSVLLDLASYLFEMEWNSVAPLEGREEKEEEKRREKRREKGREWQGAGEKKKKVEDFNICHENGIALHDWKGGRREREGGERWRKGKGCHVAIACYLQVTIILIHIVENLPLGISGVPCTRFELNMCYVHARFLLSPKCRPVFFLWPTTDKH